MMHEFRTRVSARDLDLHRTVVGAPGGSPVLLLHGITESRRYWLPRILALGARHRLILPDLPGFGLSPKPFTDYTPEFFVDSLVGLLERERLDSQPLHLIGHSLGGLIAIELARRHPHLVASLALMSIPRFNDPEEAHRVWFAGSFSYRNLLTANSVGANLAQIRRTGLRLTARYLRRLPWRVVSDARRFTFRSLTSTLENCLLHYHLDDVLESVPRLPTLLIHGEQDQVAPLAPMLELPRRHPFPALHVIRGSGHHPFHTHGGACLRLIEAHLAGMPPAALAADPKTFLVRPAGPDPLPDPR